VDNGASTFVPLWSYMLENNVLKMLAAAGRKLYVALAPSADTNG
jgi:hypothetical protein